MLKLLNIRQTSYLEKPVHKMNIGDFINLTEKATDLFVKDSQKTSSKKRSPVIVSNEFTDMFTLSGKLNKETKKDIKAAIKDGALPKRATIQDFFDKIISLIGEIPVLEE